MQISMQKINRMKIKALKYFLRLRKKGHTTYKPIYKENAHAGIKQRRLTSAT